MSNVTADSDIAAALAAWRAAERHLDLLPDGSREQERGRAMVAARREAYQRLFERHAAAQRAERSDRRGAYFSDGEPSR